jgi:hypothetical protein
MGFTRRIDWRGRCQRKRPSNVRVETPARAKRRARRRESSCAKKFITSAKANTVCVRPGRRSPSACRKRVAPASRCLHRRAAARACVSRPRATIARGSIVLRSLRRGALVLCCRRSNASRVVRRLTGRWRGRRSSQQAGDPGPTGSARHNARRARADRISSSATQSWLSRCSADSIRASRSGGMSTKRTA